MLTMQINNPDLILPFSKDNVVPLMLRIMLTTSHVTWHEKKRPSSLQGVLVQDQNVVKRTSRSLYL